MNATQLLAHFDRLAEAPNAVPRLRRFILDLAVRGKLVEQDAGDEPAAELLKRIASHKAALVKAGQLKEQPEAVDVPRSKQPFEIKQNWKWASFGSIMISRDGERIPVSKEDRNIRAKVYDYYGASGAIDKIDGFLFDKPLLLIGEDGANLINRSTPIAFIARGKYWVNNHAHVLDGISEDFLKYVELYINAIDLKAYVTGTAQPKMNQAKMNSIPVAVPPETEQHRIVAKVDELMALCDQLEAAQQEREYRRDRLAAASLQRLNQPAADTPPESQREHARFHLLNLPRLTTRPEHIKAMRQTVRSLAICGRLVPQDARDGTASEFLLKVEEDREQLAKAGEIGAAKHLEPIALDATPFPLPAGWEWARFGVLINHSDAGISPKTEGFSRSGDHWGVLKVSAVSWDRFKPEENKQLFAGLVPPDFAHVQAGDFLISRANTRELVAKCVIVDEKPVKLILSDKTVRLRLASVGNPRFWCLVNNHAEYARAYYAKEASGTSDSMKNVSRPIIYNLLIPIPPLAEQHRIVAKVDELMVVCDELEAQLTVAQTDSRRLLEAVLEAALTPI